MLNKIKSYFPVQFRVLISFYIIFLLLFGFWRLIFIYSNVPEFNNSNLLIYMQSFWIALRLDAIVVSYLFLPIYFTIYLPYIGWPSLLYRKFLIIYFNIIAIIYSLLSVIDIEFYKELGTHLNLLAILPNSRSKELWEFAWNEYPIIFYLIFITIVIIIWFQIVKLIMPYHISIKESKLKKTSFILISFILIGTMIRGGWQERPIDWGHAIFSNNHFANQVALNPIFNLGRSVIQLKSEKNRSNLMNYMEKEIAFSKTRELIITSNEYYIDSISFKRKIKEAKFSNPKNIILIVLESFLASNCGFLNEENISVTPNLNAIAKNGINFSNTFASGKRSAFGLSSILCSWPVIPGLPLISQLESQKNIETFASLLKKIDYSTYFLFGGDADFDNMKGFVRANGFDNVIEKKDFPKKTPGTMWGVFDEYLFKYAENILDSSQSPTFITLFTVTNHQPWEIPKSKQDIIPTFSSETANPKILRTMAYTDYSIGNFINQNKEKKWFDETIFIFISDHGIIQYSDMYEDPRNAHIPFVIYCPSLISNPQKINKIASHSDVIPTILHLIDYPKEYDLMGSNILAENYSGFACRVVNDYAIWFEPKLLYTEIFNQGTNLYKYNNLYKLPYINITNDKDAYIKIKNKFHAYIQSAYYYFKNREFIQ